MIRVIGCIIGLAFSLLQAMPARADEYIRASEIALVQTLLRFGALDINNDVFIDDYARVAECDLYSTFHDDDFKWNKIREGLRSKIRSETATYPSNYMITGYLRLDRYDFDTKTFKLDNKSPILGVNAFYIGEFNGTYCSSSLKVIPSQYVAVIENRVNIPGFVMSENDAQSLLDRLSKDGNTSRQILAKFNLKIIDIPHIRIDYSQMPEWYDKQTFVGKNVKVNFTAKLDSIEFYEDEDMKRRIFVYRP